MLSDLQRNVTRKMMKNVVVGMSGGVDSAVAALLLKNKGFNVIGLFMKNWDIVDETGLCQGEKDYEDAKWICDKLKISLEQVSFVKSYWNHVFSDIIDKYKNCHTPNPDILCNKYIKFDKFYKFAREHFKSDAIATGHYVRSSFGPYLENFEANTDVKLLRARDENKDQTFFLCQVPQQSIRHCMFPLGEFLKTDVKRIALEAGLDLIVRKKESMGICFVGKRCFKDFINEYVKEEPGNLIDWDTGKIMGKHQGVHHWTLGQRCHLGGLNQAFFIFRKLENHDILVVGGTNHPGLYSDMMIVKNLNWIRGEPKELSNSINTLNCMFRFQHRDPLVPCKIYKTLSQKLIIQLNEPLRALTNGQYAVLYSGEECLGSGEISYSGPSYEILNQPTNLTNHRDDISQYSASIR